MAVAVLASGMVTGVGLSAPAACAAMRAGISSFTETEFVFGGELLVGCPAPLESSWQGRERLIEMVARALDECLSGISSASPPEIPLLLCVAERERPGRLEGLDDSLLGDLEARLDRRFHPQSAVIANGRVAGVQAVERGRALIAAARPHCIVAGVDTFLLSSTLEAYHARRRLLTDGNLDGFIPGEGAAAILLGLAHDRQVESLCCLGLGYGREGATVESEEPLRADGLVGAFQGALQEAAIEWPQLDYRITDLNGEQYGFKEAALALTRCLRVRKEEFDLWHPADCIGEVGAAIVPCALGVALEAARKRYAPGPGVLCHFGNDTGERAAVVLRYGNGRRN
ncbi:MAG TPA: hypothetical protein VM118_05890 [Acidobacteriota bacterium]|nr:hypothetical protein [Acidobacteriota bacterium]